MVDIIILGTDYHDQRINVALLTQIEALKKIGIEFLVVLEDNNFQKTAENRIKEFKAAYLKNVSHFLKQVKKLENPKFTLSKPEISKLKDTKNFKQINELLLNIRKKINTENFIRHEEGEYVTKCLDNTLKYSCRLELFIQLSEKSVKIYSIDRPEFIIGDKCGRVANEDLVKAEPFRIEYMRFRISQLCHELKKGVVIALVSNQHAHRLAASIHIGANQKGSNESLFKVHVASIISQDIRTALNKDHNDELDELLLQADRQSFLQYYTNYPLQFWEVDGKNFCELMTVKFQEIIKGQTGKPNVQSSPQSATKSEAGDTLLHLYPNIIHLGLANGNASQVPEQADKEKLAQPK